MNNISFEQFCKISKVSEAQPKIDCVINFIWYHLRLNKAEQITITEINQYFQDSHLPQYNRTYLKNALLRDQRITRGTKSGFYKLKRSELEKLDTKYSDLLNTEIEIKVRVNLAQTPYITPGDLESAQKMSQLYIILHCWENSARKFITTTLNTALGENWWNLTKNSELEKKLIERKTKEQKLKWTSPRGTDNPLFYLDWGDLVKIIRKHEELFKKDIPDIKFIELRLEELERLRNVIAHNGIIPDDNDIDRIIVHFKDWCSQLYEKPI